MADHVQKLGIPALGVTMDIGHLHLASRADGLDFTREVRHALPSLVHVHVHDNFGDSTRTGSYMSALPYGFGAACREG